MGEAREHRNQQPFREHVKELRQAFVMSLLYVLIGSSIGYALYKPIFAVLIKPYHNPLYYTTPAGAFNAIFKVSIMFGIIVAIPLIAHRIYKFVSPAFPKKIHFFTAKLIGLSFLLAMAGVCYGYFVSLPTTLHFLTTVGPDNIRPLIEVSGYLNFVFNYLIGMALIFQFPLILLIINKVTPLKPGSLMKYQRHAIAGSTVIAAVITPTTDPINMGIMMIPIIALYQLGVSFVWMANRKRPEADFMRVPSDLESVVINPIPANFSYTDGELSLMPKPMPIKESRSTSVPIVDASEGAQLIEAVSVAKPESKTPAKTRPLANLPRRRLFLDVLPPTARA